MATLKINPPTITPPSFYRWVMMHYNELGFKTGNRSTVFVKGSEEAGNFVIFEVLAQDDNISTLVRIPVKSPLPEYPGWLVELFAQYREVLTQWTGKDELSITVDYFYQ